MLGPQNGIVTHRLALPHKDVAATSDSVLAVLLRSFTHQPVFGRRP